MASSGHHKRHWGDLAEEPDHFAKVDSVTISDDGIATVLFDAVRPQAGLFGVFDIAAAVETAADYWRSAFSGELPPDDPFAEMDVVAIAVADVAKDARWMQGLSEGDWFRISDQVSLDGGSLVALFQTLGGAGPEGLAEPQPRPVSDPEPLDPALAASLEVLFGMGTWPDATAAQLRSALKNVPALSQVLAYDVGQGSAIALLDSTGLARLYYDVGCGVMDNTKTAPRNLVFCACDTPTVILSHWDWDHWAGAPKAPDLLRSNWIAPRQSIGPNHTKFANSILRASGSILIFDKLPTLEIDLQPLVHWQPPAVKQKLRIERCKGKDRNDCGLALIIEDVELKSSWLLVGDADFRFVPSASSPPAEICVLSAAHHGAALHKKSVAPGRTRATYARLIYSFGYENSYDHPRDVAIAMYVAADWKHPDTWPVGRDVIATSTKAAPQTRNSVAAGWKQKPLAAKHMDTAHNIKAST